MGGKALFEMMNHFDKPFWKPWCFGTPIKFLVLFLKGVYLSAIRFSHQYFTKITKWVFLIKGVYIAANRLFKKATWKSCNLVPGWCISCRPKRKLCGIGDSFAETGTIWHSVQSQIWWIWNRFWRYLRSGRFVVGAEENEQTNPNWKMEAPNFDAPVLRQCTYLGRMDR